MELNWGRVVQEHGIIYSGTSWHILTSYRGEAVTLCDPEKPELFRMSRFPDWDLRCRRCLDIQTREMVLSKLGVR